MIPSTPVLADGVDHLAAPGYCPPPCAPITRAAVLAQLAHAVRVMAGDPAAADEHVSDTLPASGWTWGRLLDLRVGLRGDELDTLLADLTSDVPPLGWRHSLVGLPLMAHWTPARIVWMCAAHLPPRHLAEAAVLANQDAPCADDMTRLEALARMAWRARRRAMTVEPVRMGA